MWKEGYSKFFDQEMVYHIGCIAIETATLDLMLGLNIQMHKAFEIVLDSGDFAHDTRKKVKLLTECPISNETRSVLRSMPFVLAERNLFIHGALVFSEDNEPLITTNRGKFKGSSNTVSVERSVKLLSVVNSVNKVLIANLASKLGVSY